MSGLKREIAALDRASATLHRRAGHVVTPVRITSTMLRKKGASARQIAAFDREWPDGVEISLDTLWRIAALEAHLSDFLASRFLSATARRVFSEATESARRAFFEAKTPSRFAFAEARMTALWNAWQSDITKQVTP